MISQNPERPSRAVVYSISWCREDGRGDWRSPQGLLGAIEGFHAGSHLLRMWGPDYSQRKETGLRSHVDQGLTGSAGSDPLQVHLALPCVSPLSVSPHSDSKAAQARLGNQAGEGAQKKTRRKNF